MFYEPDIENDVYSISQKSASYIFKQVNKINGYDNNNQIFSEILLNNNLIQENGLISQITYKSLSYEIDSAILQESISQRHIIEPFKLKHTFQSPFQKHKSCTICYNDTNEIKQIEKCQHEFCKQCLKEYILNKIINGQVVNIKCPMNGCQEQLTDLFIKQNIPQQIYEKYQRFLLIKQYENYTNGKWCPQPNCFTFVLQIENSKLLKCNMCGQEFCFDCGNPQHPNKTCEENADQTFVKAIQDYKIYGCPRCKVKIEKNGGCNHMQCVNCGYQFCWLCRRKYSSIHYSWLNPFSCPGEQYQQSDPYQCPLIMFYIRAIIKILIYILLLPLLILMGIGILLYGFTYLMVKLGKIFSR